MFNFLAEIVLEQVQLSFDIMNMFESDKYSPSSKPSLCKLQVDIKNQVNGKSVKFFHLV